MKVKGSDLNLVLVCLTFYEITIIPHYVFLGFKYLVLFWLLYRYHKEWRKNKIVLTIVALYGLLTWFSSIINGMAFNTVFASFVFGIQILDIYLICIYYINHKSFGKLVRIIMYTFLALLLANDVLMIFIKYNFYDSNEQYFIGNKFVVSYLHCFVSMLAFMEAKRISRISRYDVSLYKKTLKIKNFHFLLFSLLYLVYSIIICVKVTCATGAIACVVMLIVCFLPERMKFVMSNGKVIIIITMLANVLVFGTYSLFSMPFFENIIYNVLGKSYTWTGRLIIWQQIFDLFKDSPIIGYGYYNNMVAELVGFGNPQNGILKLMIDTGIAGLVFYGMIVWKCFQPCKKASLSELYPLVSFMYAMIAASIVEINLTHMIVFMAMAIYYAENGVRRSKLKNEDI